MEAASNFLDVASPSSSYRYLYCDHGQHLNAHHSEPHSAATSPVSLPRRPLVLRDTFLTRTVHQHEMVFPGEFSGISAFPSPESRDADDGSDSPHELSATTDTPPKSTAKRKRENRYKNAPPSVLSVSERCSHSGWYAQSHRRRSRASAQRHTLQEGCRHRCAMPLSQARGQITVQATHPLPSFPEPCVSHLGASPPNRYSPQVFLSKKRKKRGQPRD